MFRDSSAVDIRHYSQDERTPPNPAGINTAYNAIVNGPHFCEKFCRVLLPMMVKFRHSVHAI